MTALDLPDIDAEEARERLSRVRSHVTQAWDDLVALFLGRAWVALGYESWDDLCDAELGGARIALPRDERREVVARMAGAGLNNVAIAEVIGVDETTVRRDRISANAEMPDTVIRSDGTTYTRPQPRTATVTTTTVETNVVDLDTGQILDDIADGGAAEQAGRDAADRAYIPALPPRRKTEADYERERLTQQNGWLVRAIKHLDGVEDAAIRSRLVAEWDPDLCDDNPVIFTPDRIREIGHGLVAFAKEMESLHGLRIVR